MTHHVKPVPEGYHTLTAAVVVGHAAKAIEFCTKAFGAKETLRMHGPDGKGILHAETRIGDSILFLGDEGPGMGL